MPEAIVRYPLCFQRSNQPVIDAQVIQRFSQLAQNPSPYQLPPDLGYFIGRQAELHQNLILLQQAVYSFNPVTRIMAIAGDAGLGKSAFAIHLAHQLKTDFPDAQLYVDLRGNERHPTDPADVLVSFLRAWGIEDDAIPTNLPERSQFFQQLVAGNRTLLVLDNAADDTQIAPLIPAGITCGVIVTSRKPLPRLNDAARLKLAPFSDADALTLLQTLAGAKRIQSGETTHRLIQLCEGNPLALSLIGSMVNHPPVESLESVIKQLDAERQRLDPLGSSSSAIRSCFMVSYQTLNPDAARLLRGLGLLSEPDFTAAIAPALLDSSEADAQEAIAQLVSRQLLHPLGNNRYRLHSVIRRFAKNQLALEESADARHATRLHISQWYSDAAQVLNLTLDPATRGAFTQAVHQMSDRPDPLFQNAPAAALNWFTIEYSTILTAFEWAEQSQDCERVAAFALSLAPFFDRTRNQNGWEHTHQRALALTQITGDRLKEAQLWTHLGHLDLRYQQFERAKTRYEKSIALFQDQRNLQGEALGLAHLGLLEREQSQIEKAIAFWEIAFEKLAATPPAQKKLIRWMQMTDSALFAQINRSQNAEATPDTDSLFKNLGGTLRKWFKG
ncbi:MAG: ATP-binding protein [Elainellaceae cyanobacterium]